MRLKFSNFEKLSGIHQPMHEQVRQTPHSTSPLFMVHNNAQPSSQPHIPSRRLNPSLWISPRTLLRDILDIACGVHTRKTLSLYTAEHSGCGSGAREDGALGLVLAAAAGTDDEFSGGDDVAGKRAVAGCFAHAVDLSGDLGGGVEGGGGDGVRLEGGSGDDGDEDGDEDDECVHCVVCGDGL